MGLICSNNVDVLCISISQLSASFLVLFEYIQEHNENGNYIIDL